MPPARLMDFVCISSRCAGDIVFVPENWPHQASCPSVYMLIQPDVEMNGRVLCVSYAAPTCEWRASFCRVCLATGGEVWQTLQGTNAGDTRNSRSGKRDAPPHTTVRGSTGSDLDAFAATCTGSKRLVAKWQNAAELRTRRARGMTCRRTIKFVVLRDTGHVRRVWTRAPGANLPTRPLSGCTEESRRGRGAAKRPTYRPPAPPAHNRAVLAKMGAEWGC